MSEREIMEKKAKEKEMAFQERLRDWETRERRKKKETREERNREKQREEELAQEVKEQRQFLEDYDDERDDVKYYKGRELQKRLMERKREREADSKDRQRERRELNRLKKKIIRSGHKDPRAVYKKVLKEYEEIYKPKVITDAIEKKDEKLTQKWKPLPSV